MITIAQLRERLGLPADQDQLLSSYRDAVVALWEQMTGKPWERRVDHVEIFQPQHERIRSVWLNLLPIEAIAKVEERYDGGAWEELTVDDDYELLGRRQLYRVDSYWPAFVRVTYTGGYVAEPTGNQAKTPADVANALLIQAHFLHVRTGQEKLVTKSQNFEGGSGAFEEATVHPHFAMLAKAKRRTL